MNTLKKWSTSIWTIVIAFWLFFPLGFVLLYIRLKDKYGKYSAITKMLFWVGIVWFALGVFYLGASIGEENYISEYVPAGIFLFIIPGVIMFFFGNKRRLKTKVYDKYLSYITSRRKIKIDDLCNKINVDYDTANNVLTDMISKGMINGYISDDELFIKGINDLVDAINEEPQKKETKIVKCKECGAKNAITIGEIKECEYCGSRLM